MKRAIWPGIALLAALCLLAGAGTAARAEALTKVRCLIPVRNVDEAFSPFPVAKYMGYFVQEGLDVDFIAVGGSNEAAIQVSSGNADLGAASPAEAIIGMQSGQSGQTLQVKYFYDLYYRNIWSISVEPDSPIKTVADLKGKKLGVQSMGSAALTFGRAFLTQAKLDPDRDVTFIAIGAGAQAMTAVRQKVVDAIVFWDAALAKFEVSGLKLRNLPLDERLANLPDVGLLARLDTIRDRPKMLTGFARAVAKGFEFTMANPEAAVRITWKLYPEAEPRTLPPDVALRNGITVNQRRMAIWHSDKTHGVHGEFIAPDWASLVDFLRERGSLKETVPTDRVFTNQFIPAINKFDVAAVREQAKSFDMGKLK